MDGGGDQSPGGQPVPVTQGEWTGWSAWPSDPFETINGPFYFRREPDGRVRTAFVAERRHMNAFGFMHGGCVMSFADYSLFMIAYNEIEAMHGVTISLNGEFVGSVQVGARVEATGEVVRAGGSLIFVRGLVTADGETALSFSGVLRRLRPS